MHSEEMNFCQTSRQNRNRKRNKGKLEELRAKRKELQESIAAEAEAIKEANRQESIAKVVSGEISIYSATGLTEEEIEALASGNHRSIARRKLLPKAFAVVDSAMSSYDEKVALAGAKLAVEMSEPTAEELEEMQKSQKVKTKRIERRVIDVTG